MNNEIKQGDKVKVSENAPKVYLSGANNLFKYHLCKVEETDGGSAKIRYTDIGIDRWLAIPTKYLVKADTEAKEAKFKLGGKVKLADSVMLNGQETYDNLRNLEWEVLGYEGDSTKYLYTIKSGESYLYNVREEMLEFVPPTEQTEEEEDVRIRQMETELDEFRKSELDRMLHPENPTFEVTIDNVTMNWQRYAADLAKEVALKVTNKKMDNLPKEIGEYAVLVAKAVVEGLKRK